MPNESTGYLPDKFTFANYLTNSFGQFDNYDNASAGLQYASTEANNGKRVAPHIVEGIYGNSDQGGLGDLVQKIDTKELNQVNISDEDMSIIKQGFYQVVHGSSGFTTGRTISQGESVPTAKTGTAETFRGQGQESSHQ